jgi:23S rRNA (uracil747-C5)-methyltransferase
MHCFYYDAGLCRSCRWLPKPYSEQISEKQNDLLQRLKSHSPFSMLTPVLSEPLQFRNKAKMAVSGSVEKPVLGIYTAEDNGVDLCDCPLYAAALRPSFSVLKTFIAKAGLTPYNIERKKGELKFILITCNDKGELMLRFILRSENKLIQLRNALPWLQAQLPQAKVVSANIQPVHMAILEGDTEIIFTEQQTLEQKINHVSLFVRPKSFFQTNSAVTGKLYQTAQNWIGDLNVKHLWDLFCGVGGFGLHCANQYTQLTGIEISAEAIECAKISARQLELTNVNFQALDLKQPIEELRSRPDLVIVNPPRRGIGNALCRYLAALAPDYILYSSCNAASMADDITLLDGYQIDKVQLFDMFPHTEHYEVLTLLRKR